MSVITVAIQLHAGRLEEVCAVDDQNATSLKVEDPLRALELFYARFHGLSNVISSIWRAWPRLKRVMTPVVD